MSTGKYSAIDIANHIIDRSTEYKQKYPLSALRLRSVVFLCRVVYRKIIGEDLFREDIYKWQYGATVMSLFHAFKGWGYKSIDKTICQFRLTGDGFIDIPYSKDTVSDSDKVVLNTIFDSLHRISTREIVDGIIEDDGHKKFRDEINRGNRDLIYSDNEICNNRSIELIYMATKDINIKELINIYKSTF